MAVPDHLLVHTVTVVEPAEVTDGYGNTTYDYDAGSRTEVRAWLQQDQRFREYRDGRDPLDERWLLVANHIDISGRARIEWADHPQGPVTFVTAGPTEPAYSPAGLHHLEAALRIVSG